MYNNHFGNHEKQPGALFNLDNILHTVPLGLECQWMSMAHLFTRLKIFHHVSIHFAYAIIDIPILAVCRMFVPS